MKKISLILVATLMLSCFSLTSCKGTVDTGKPTGSEQVSSGSTSDATQPDTQPGTDTGTNSGTNQGTNPEEETSPVTLYQLAPEKESLMMSYVIKTAHNKLIVIDGGIDGAGIDEVPYLPAALRAIAGVGDNGYFEIEAWFLTHAHLDHIYELSKMLKNYSANSNFKINNIYFDFPPFGTDAFTGTSAEFDASKLRTRLNAYGKAIGAEVKEGMDYYDTINGAVINAEAIKKGLEFNIDGVRIEVLQTWDIQDGYSNFNDTSLIMRAWVDGQSILFFGDAANSGDRLLKTYGDALKSDIVQMAHHGQSGVNKAVYAAVNAQVHLWPTPVWVWNNENNAYQIGTTRKWLYGEDFFDVDEYNIVAGMYEKYPERIDSVEAWSNVLEYMSITLPYDVPFREGALQPEGPDADFTPVDTPYVEDGLVHCYSGDMNTRNGHDNDATVWEDLVSGYDITVEVTDNNHFVDDGLYVNSTKNYFPETVGDVLNGNEFTYEMLLGDFTSIGTDFNEILMSTQQHIDLFRRNSHDVLELKLAGIDDRIQIPNCLETIQNALITITYRKGEFVRLYINGELKGEAKASADPISISGLFFGHDASDSSFETVFRSIRFYNRALTDAECAANAEADGVKS